MRGLVNNLNEIKNDYILISKEREHLVNNTNRLWNNIYKVSENYHLKLVMYNIILMLHNIIFNSITYIKFRHIINMSLNILLVYIIGYNYYQYYKTICYDKGNIKNKNDITLTKNKDITTELIKLEESTLALDSWIYKV